MTNKLKVILAGCTSALFLAACSTPAQTADGTSGPSQGKTVVMPDPRQGKEVKQICFNQQIRNWHENDKDRHSVIIEKGVKEEYKLDLIGGCRPEDAFLNIGLISRVGGGSCLTQGDRLVTDTRFDGSCSITKMYEWHKDAGKTTTASN